ncbi:3-oxoacyl-[acyl-carrier-protein] synthase-3 [Lutibacter sp. Hel_I_33_5]|uniref:3-oxoacyl-ACP synthase III family protein n=1 Tax=Lutibacter sp. Hel_I_33_5 TaxID=1566289 RepID=UPI0011A1CF87|nr:3-oxoacyl-ACP synthase III family protein [Lutibacter sp. Hel_I_33_5]TVZ55476.1 3-oxoacyl-[acyl-carrier-protein] synthase-3 [Lutibacter sp. Hel_I_33_5]
MISSIISGTGSYIPSIEKKNTDFLDAEFLNEDGTAFSNSNEEIIEKFKLITGIASRRYAEGKYNTSDLAAFASEKAIKKAGIDKEELDYIIVAHNYGDVKSGSTYGDLLPSLASRVKNKLEIKNPNCVGYDLLFGCPGWIEGVIQANAFIKAGIANKCLVIGAETLSRVVDEFDRDSMIFSDGAGACIIEAKENVKSGILQHATQTFAEDEAFYLFNGDSYNSSKKDTNKYIKMHGRKVYEFALTNVPKAMQSALDKSDVSIDEVKKVFIHQANEKMDEAIIKRFFRLYKKQVPEHVMPMSIHELGNSSVATVPTLLDLVINGELENHELNKNDVIILASVGAGMNINAIVYRY